MPLDEIKQEQATCIEHMDWYAKNYYGVIPNTPHTYNEQCRWWVGHNAWLIRYNIITDEVMARQAILAADMK